MSAAVFLSYSSKDRDLPQFRALLEDLENLDRPAWYDERLRGGIEWWRDIIERIASCDLVVAVLTEKSLASVACQREVQYALDAGRPVLPVALAKFPAVMVPEALKPMEIIDYTERSTDLHRATRCLARLGNAIHALEAQPASPRGTPPPPAPEMPPSYVQVLTRYVYADELTLAEQHRMLEQVKELVNDNPDDRQQLLEAIEQLLDREDISWKVQPQLIEVANRLAGSSRSRAGTTGTPVQATTEHRPTRGGSRPVTRVFRAHGANLALLADDLTRYFATEGLSTDVSRDSDGSYVIRCASSKPHARMSGAGAAMTTRLTMTGDDLVVTVSGQRWADKAASLTGGIAATMMTSGFALPMVAPSIVGGYRQATLPRKTFEHLEQVLR